MQIIPIELLRAADGWEREASDRRRISPVDPVADTLAFCAADLRERAKQAEAARTTLTTSEFARLNDVSSGSVRKWIARGELQAERGIDNDWRIPVTAKRRVKREAASSVKRRRVA